MLRTFLISAIFPGLAFAAYYLLWVSPLRSALGRFKIHRKGVEARQLKTEVVWTLLYPVFSTVLVVGVISLLVRFQISQVYFDFNQHSLIYFLSSIPAYILFADFIRYWSHRLMHTIPFLYNNIHYLHHRSVNVNPLSTLSMHPLDLLSGTPWLLATNIFPVHISVVIAFANFYHLQNLHRHLGYDFLGERGMGGMIGRVIISPRNHDLHHTEVGVNFGATLTLWDRLFGTLMNPKPAAQLKQGVNEG
jgi:Delta7-sterol 5-desaturase